MLNRGPPCYVAPLEIATVQLHDVRMKCSVDSKKRYCFCEKLELFITWSAQNLEN